MYLILVALAYCVAYIGLLYLFSLFFRGPAVRWEHISLRSLALIVAWFGGVVYITFILPDLEIGNRILHAFGGGFLVVGMCWLVVRDLDLQLSPLEFFLFSFLVVNTLGVGNEIMEFILQTFSPLSFAQSVNDTWLDLSSNVTGALIANALLIPLFHIKKKSGS